MSITPSGLKLRTSHRALRSAVELLSSMRFAIGLLVVLAIASIIGTVLKQDDPYPNYVNQFGPFWADIFRALGLYAVYGSWWFLLILGFLVVSVSLCVLRNGPKAIDDMRSWKERVREGSLRAFHHRAEYDVPLARADAAARISALLKRRGYRYVARNSDGATLIAAKRGAFNRLGYIFAHVAIVVICIGGLIDGNLPIRAQMWLLGKSPVPAGAPMDSALAPEHRLAASNPTFRGYAWVPEGQQVSTALLNQSNGTLIQDLPFTLQLNKFSVGYYSTGMPKLFASDIVVIDRATGRRIPARVEVNHPFTYDGVSIYQSSFEDGGSTLKLTAWPMRGASATAAPFDGKVGGAAALAGDTVEFTDFRPINVENLTDAAGKTDARGVVQRSLLERFDQRLGSGAKASAPRNLHNVGPSVQYKLRDSSGQAREFNNYMLPIEIDGERVFLAGMRTSPDAPFRYLRIPADADGTVKEWMLLRAALQNPQLRARAAADFAHRMVDRNDRSGVLQQHLDQSALRVLNLFAGAGPTGSGGPTAAAGFAAVAGFIDASVPKAEQEKAADLLLRLLEGSVWDLWQQARVRAGEAPLQPSADNDRFVESAINALSDSFFYGAPVFLQLDSFHEIKASVFQLTRAPGKKIVYLGALLLVLGIFSMFYVRERRVWFLLKDAGAADSSSALMAMSTARRTLDFESEFAAMRDAAAAALGVRTISPSDMSSPTVKHPRWN